MKTFQAVPTFIALTLLGGCASNPVQIIESTSNRPMPEWVERQVYEDGSKTYMVGSAVVESGTSSGCFIGSDEKAISEFGRNLITSFLDQSTVVEGSSDEPVSKRVISSLRNERPQIDDLRIVDRYSALVKVDAHGYSRTERRCYSLASASTAKVQAAVQVLARKLRGENSGQGQSLEAIAASQRKVAQ